jgi:hypothetical protein
MHALRYDWAPLRVFLAWHPNFEPGRSLFASLYAWFGGPARSLHRNGTGIPVQAWSSRDAERPPGMPPTETQDLTVVVVLLDGEFIGRRAWREWLGSIESLIGDGRRLVILPWAVHEASAQVDTIRPLHLLGAGRCEETVLRRRVTEACVVRLRDHAGVKPVRVFVSYARTDGAPIAREIRRALQGYGHLSVFFDEHDLQPGSRWRDELNIEIDDGAAMFAVVTDAYASRAWCREELRRFREPRQEKSPARWWLRPVFILDSLSGNATRSMFEVGSAPAARWNPARAEHVVDDLVLEMLFAEANRARATKTPQEAGVHVINWTPDTWTLLHVLRAASAEDHRVIAYPGDGLPRIEAERLSTMLPGTSLLSFEELQTKPAGSSSTTPSRSLHPSAPRSPILLSISNPPVSDLAERGLQETHLDDAAVRIARALLNDDFDVMYGGRPRDGFTGGFQDNSAAVVIEPRLLNHVGWPHSGDLTATQVANEFGVTRYVAIRWEHVSTPDRSNPLHIAQAASHTRLAATVGELRDLDNRAVPPRIGLIALGGAIRGFAGFLPGVAEEIAVAMEHGLAVFVLGGFGGAAEQAAMEIMGKGSTQLGTSAFVGDEKYDKLRQEAGAAGQQELLTQRIAWLSGVLRNGDLRNGLTAGENVELMQTMDIGKAIALIRRGLNERRRQQEQSAPRSVTPG